MCQRFSKFNCQRHSTELHEAWRWLSVFSNMTGISSQPCFQCDSYPNGITSVIPSKIYYWMLCYVNQQTVNFFKNNILIQFLFSTCFEHLIFITRKTICTCSFFYRVFFVRLCKRSNRWEDEFSMYEGCAESNALHFFLIPE